MNADSESLAKIVIILDNLLKNDKYSNDFDLIENLKSKINDLICYKEVFDLQVIDYIKEKLYYLEEKYNDIFDLTYYYDPIYITIKNNIHKKEIADLRKKQRKRKKV
ncbi:MAG: hypothetical protein IKH54_02010 [Bacilli bacterium]|nr:hypothetical protein [Bacilli bacterium]